MSGLLILVVDDDPDVRELMSQLLELEGHRAQGAADGQEALMVLRRGLRPDAILLDLRMPGMNGWEFRAAQLAAPELASIPVYILTADRTQEMEDIRSLCATGFFHKPLDVDALLDALGHLQPAKPPVLIRPVEDLRAAPDPGMNQAPGPTSPSTLGH